MKIKERHVSGAILQVEGDEEKTVMRFVRQWRRAVDSITTVVEAPEEAKPPTRDEYGTMEMGFRP